MTVLWLGYIVYVFLWKGGKLSFKQLLVPSALITIGLMLLMFVGANVVASAQNNAASMESAADALKSTADSVW